MFGNFIIFSIFSCGGASQVLKDAQCAPEFSFDRTTKQRPRARDPAHTVRLPSVAQSALLPRKYSPNYARRRRHIPKRTLRALAGESSASLRKETVRPITRDDGVIFRSVPSAH